MKDWRAESKRLRPGQQADLGFWVGGIEPIPHDHRYDVLWTSEGATPPCKLKPWEPGYEPCI